jgi:hypothetical protein
MRSPEIAPQNIENESKNVSVGITQSNVSLKLNRFCQTKQFCEAKYIRFFFGRLYGQVATYLDHFSIVGMFGRSTPQKLLVQCLSNFTGMISTKFSCADRRHFLVQCFNQSSCPLMILFLKFVLTTSPIHFKQL